MFDEKLKLLLKKNNVTAYKVAKDTGISQGLMGEYKNGIKTPSSKNIVKIAKYFNVPVDYLLDRGNNNPNSTEQVTLDSTEIAKRIRETAKRIKKLAHKNGVSVTKMLSECHLGKNSVDKMSNGGDMLTSNIVKIADHLGCSIDYLLGRTDNPDVNPLNADFFRILLSDDGLNAIKAPLKRRIEAYGYEKLEQETGYTLMDLKLFLTSDISVGATVNSTLDRLLVALETNLYDLIRESIYDRNVNEISFHQEIAAFGGEATRAEQPPIIPEVTAPQK